MILFRCDGGDRVGAGHVARCLQIALAFRTAGDEVLFAGEYGGMAADLLTAAGVETVAAEHAPDDGELTVFDSYEAPLPDHSPLAVIADEPGATLERAIEIDYHLDADGPEIAGPAYAPVAASLVGARRERGFERVLVTAGAGSAGAELRERARAACEERGLELVPPAVGLTGPIAAADVAAGAAGVTAYELACAGLPAALVPVAPEQERVARTFADAGIAITGSDVAELIDRLADPAVREGIARRGPAIIDGYGAFRVRDALRAMVRGDDPPEPLLYRPASEADSQLQLAWRNDHETRAVSHTKHEIGAQEHERWFAGVLADPDRTLLIAESDEGPMGSVRFDRSGDEAEISVVVAPERRGGGLGRRIVRESSELMLAGLAGLERVRAEVEEGNDRSASAFRRAGFAAAGDGASPLFLDRTALASRPV